MALKLETDKIEETQFWTLKQKLMQVKEQNPDQDPFNILLMILDEADKLYESIQQVRIKDKISMQHYNNGIIEYKESTETELVKASSEAWTKHYNADVMAHNLVALINFYKTKLQRTLLYEPFFDEIKPLIKEISEYQRDFREIDILRREKRELLEKQRELESELQKETTEKAAVVEAVNQYKAKFVNVARDKRMLHYLLNTLGRDVDKEKSAKLLKIVMYLIFEGRSEMQTLVENVLEPKDLSEVLDEFKDLFIVDNGMVDFRKEGIDWTPVKEQLDSLMGDKKFV